MHYFCGVEKIKLNVKAKGAMRYNSPLKCMKNHVMNFRLRRTVLLLFLFICVANYVNAQYTWKPAVYSGGSVYQPQTADFSTLQRSLEQIEQREQAANDQYAKLITRLSEYGNQLYNDRETLIWFDQYKRKIQSNFYSLLGISTSEALNYAIRTQGEIANDSELQARIRTADEYRSLIKDIEARTDMTWQEKQEWIQSHPYRFVAITNAEGKVIGGRLGGI